MREKIMCLCAKCGVEKPRGEFNTRADNVRQPNCRSCGTPRKSQKIYQVCTTCGTSKQRATEFARLTNGTYQPECKVCKGRKLAEQMYATAQRKAAEKAARKEKREKKAAEKVVREEKPVVVPNVAVNAFHWREFVQPFQPPPEKWGSAHKTTPTKAQGITL